MFYVLMQNMYEYDLYHLRLGAIIREKNTFHFYSH